MLGWTSSGRFTGMHTYLEAVPVCTISTKSLVQALFQVIFQVVSLKHTD